MLLSSCTTVSSSLDTHSTVALEGSTPSDPHITCSFSMTALCNYSAVLAVFSCRMRQLMRSYSAGSISIRYISGGAVFCQAVGSCCYNSEALWSPKSVLLRDMSQLLLVSCSKNSKTRCSSRSKKKMKFLRLDYSQNIFWVSAWQMTSSDLGRSLEQEMPPLKSVARKAFTSSSLTALSQGLVRSLSPEGPGLLRSRMRQSATCSRMPLSTRKQKSASVGQLQARKLQKRRSPGSLGTKWLRESMRLTRSCSALSLSRREAMVLRQNHSAKLMARTCADFFLCYCQKRQQLFSTNSQRLSSDIRFGQTQISIERCSYYNRFRSPIRTARDNCFLPPFSAPSFLPSGLLLLLGLLGLALSLLLVLVLVLSALGLSLSCATYWLSLCWKCMLEWAMSSTHIFFCACDSADMLISMLFILLQLLVYRLCVINQPCACWPACVPPCSPSQSPSSTPG